MNISSAWRQENELWYRAPGGRCLRLADYAIGTGTTRGPTAAGGASVDFLYCAKSRGVSLLSAPTRLPPAPCVVRVYLVHPQHPRCLRLTTGQMHFLSIEEEGMT